MKVLLRKNISKLGKIGELVEVKSGYARNYLLPQGLAVEPTKMNLRTIEIEKEKYMAELAARKGEFEAQAAVCQGKEVTIHARANEEGHLYGSIGPAQIAAAMAEQGVIIDVENIVLDTPIRQVDKYDVTVSFTDEIKATIFVWIVPIHEEGDEVTATQVEPTEKPVEKNADEDEKPEK